MSSPQKAPEDSLTWNQTHKSSIFSEMNWRMTVLGIAALSLTGCSAGIIDTRGNSRSPYAPVNETELRGGLVKLDCGKMVIAAILKKCEEDGEDLMRAFCGGDFQITQRSPTLTGEVETEEVQRKIFGLTVTETIPKESPYQYLYFDCGQGGHEANTR
jgi:hypothetical protein